MSSVRCWVRHEKDPPASTAKSGTSNKPLIAFLKTRGWLVERMIGNAFQMGIPDLFCHHPKWGQRWIDVKRPGKNYTFTKAQKRKWPVWDERASASGFSRLPIRKNTTCCFNRPTGAVLEGVVGSDS